MTRHRGWYVAPTSVIDDTDKRDVGMTRDGLRFVELFKVADGFAELQGTFRGHRTHGAAAQR